MHVIALETGVKEPLGITAYRAIYRKIITLEYEPGMRLEEKQLVEYLGIGRTPIREALLRLESDFMVESQPSKGYVVKPITIQNIKSAFAAMKIMEMGVAELALKQDIAQMMPELEKANEEVKTAIKDRDILGIVEANSLFHQRYSECSKNDYLIHGLYKIRCETNRLAYLSFNNEIDPLRKLEDHYASVIEQHESMVYYLNTRDEDNLKAVVLEHSQAFQNRIAIYMAT